MSWCHQVTALVRFRRWILLPTQNQTADRKYRYIDLENWRNKLCCPLFGIVAVLCLFANIIFHHQSGDRMATAESLLLKEYQIVSR